MHFNIPRRFKMSKKVFPGIIVSAVLVGILLNIFHGEQIVGSLTFVFIILVWLIGLCLHEFSHAYAGFRFGDRTVISKGYLNLNPLNYGSFLFSFAIPLAILIIGATPLPGAAVTLRHDLIRSRNKIAITYAVGPMANFVFAIGLSFLLVFVRFLPASDNLINAISASIYFQFLAVIINLLPFPSFDGYGIVSTYMPARFRMRIRKYEKYVLYVVIFMMITAPSSTDDLRALARGFCSIVGAYEVEAGLRFF